MCWRQKHEEVKFPFSCRQNMDDYLLTCIFLFLVVHGSDCQCKLSDINQLKGLLRLDNQLVAVDSGYKLFDLKDVYQDRLHFYSVTKRSVTQKLQDELSLVKIASPKVVSNPSNSCLLFKDTSKGITDEFKIEGQGDNIGLFWKQSYVIRDRLNITDLKNITEILELDFHTIVFYESRDRRKWSRVYSVNYCGNKDSWKEVRGPKVVQNEDFIPEFAVSWDEYWIAVYGPFFAVVADFEIIENVRIPPKRLKSIHDWFNCLYDFCVEDTVDAMNFNGQVNEIYRGNYVYELEPFNFVKNSQLKPLEYQKPVDAVFVLIHPEQQFPSRVVYEIRGNNLTIIEVSCNDLGKNCKNTHSRGTVSKFFPGILPTQGNPIQGTLVSFNTTIIVFFNGNEFKFDIQENRENISDSFVLRNGYPKNRRDVFNSLKASTSFRFSNETVTRFLFSAHGQLKEYFEDTNKDSWNFVANRPILPSNCFNDASDRDFYRRYLGVINLNDLQKLKESVLLDPPPVPKTTTIVTTTEKGKSIEVDVSRFWYKVIIVGIASLFFVTIVVIIAYVIYSRQSLSMNTTTSKLDSWSSRDTVPVLEKDGQGFHGVE